MTPQEITSKLTAYRRDNKCSISYMARMLEVPERAISQSERGNVPPTIDENPRAKMSQIKARAKLERFFDPEMDARPYLPPVSQIDVRLGELAQERRKLLNAASYIVNRVKAIDYEVQERKRQLAKAS